MAKTQMKNRNMIVKKNLPRSQKRATKKKVKTRKKAQLQKLFRKKRRKRSLRKIRMTVATRNLKRHQKDMNGPVMLIAKVKSYGVRKAPITSGTIRRIKRHTRRDSTRPYLNSSITSKYRTKVCLTGNYKILEIKY